MKIALVTPYDYPYPGGITEHIRHLDREFRARGHDTRIIAPSSESQDALESNVIKVSGDVLPIPFNGSTARITLSPEVSRRIEGILNVEQFDIVYLHEPEAPLLGWAVWHASRAINVGTFHAYSEANVLNEYAQPFMEWIHMSHLTSRAIAAWCKTGSKDAWCRRARKMRLPAASSRCFETLGAASGWRREGARYDWQIVAPRVLDYYQELIQARALRRTGRQYALASRDPKLAQKVNSVNAVLNSLMHGLSLIETQPVPHNRTPGAAHRLGERRFAIASPSLPGMKVSAQMNNLFKFELVVKS